MIILAKEKSKTLVEISVWILNNKNNDNTIALMWTYYLTLFSLHVIIKEGFQKPLQVCQMLGMNGHDFLTQYRYWI